MTEKKEEKQESLEAEADDDIITVKEITVIEDGKHKGHISNMIRDTRQGFDYIDIYIEFDGEDGSIKTGFPCNISEMSNFGKLIKSAGIEFEAGDKISLADVKAKLIGRNLEFKTFRETDFARVVNKTIEFVD